jgi:UDP-2,3-diacylglucosamine hydrolase
VSAAASASIALGIVAGSGPLPGLIAAAARAAGRSVFLIGLAGFAEPAALASYPHEFVRLGAVGRMKALLQAHGCGEIVLIGAIRRPSIRDLRPDAEGARLLARIGRATFGGDDRLLAAVVRVLEEEGFRVIGAQEVLAEALPQPGILTRLEPDPEARADIERGVEVARALGANDVGQGCVVQQGVVLAVEAAEGTDAMLVRAGTLRLPGPGGVLVKLVKPGQERRVDLPTIGLDTLRNAAAAGLRGIAFEAGGTILAGGAETIATAEARGLFLQALDPNTGFRPGRVAAGQMPGGGRS